MKTHAHKHGGATRRTGLGAAGPTGGSGSALRGGRAARATHAVPLPEQFSVMLKVQRFLRNCKRKGVDVRSALHSIHDGEAGRASKVGFKRVLSDMGMDLSADEMEALTFAGSKSDTRTVPVHGLVGSLTRKLSPAELAEQQKDGSDRVLMSEDELEFAEHLSVLFNLIDSSAASQPSRQIRQSSEKKNPRPLHHKVHRGHILRALSSDSRLPGGSLRSGTAREYAELIPSLHPLLNVASYEASLYAYAAHSGGDLIDVDEFVDFWFHHIPDHVREHIEAARGLVLDDEGDDGGDVFSTNRDRPDVEGNTVETIAGAQISGSSGSAAFVAKNKITDNQNNNQVRRRRASHAIPADIKRPHHDAEFAIQVDVPR